MHQNTLEEAKSHFNYWRATRLKRGKIPVHWDKVKAVIDHYPLIAITQTLSLNTNQIRENINIDTSIHFARTETLLSPARKPIVSLSVDSQTCSIELHRISGGALKISALPVASLPAIISQFMV